ARKDDREGSPGWEAVGAQFQHPYVFKTLFTQEELTFDDLCETKQVQKGAIYLDFDAVEKAMFDYRGMHFVGRIGRFIPVIEGAGGGILYRVHEDKPYHVAATKDYLWKEAEHVRQLNKRDLADIIDESYYERLADEAEIGRASLAKDSR